MLSKQSQDLIEKNWPEAANNKILLQIVKERMIERAYPFGRPKDAKEKYLEKIHKRAKSMRFLTYATGLLATLTVIGKSRHFSTVVAYVDSLVYVVMALGCQMDYREIRKLINCYNELKSEVEHQALNNHNEMW